jgi:tRNA (guanine37-N1)-methyltransferase
MRVPDVLLSGHHANIARWRRKQSILRTRRRRPDMYSKCEFTDKEDLLILKEIENEPE